MASSQAKRDELVVTPAAGIVNGRPFTVVVDYSGKPEPLSNAALGVGGWLRTTDGGFALGQPESASTWFPVNDHPRDKATYKLAMTVPDGLEALSNGVPLASVPLTTAGPPGAGPRARRWRSYLATVVIGQYRVETGTHKGKPMVTAMPESLPANGPGAKSIARTGEIADFLETQFGPYPFDAYGGIVLDDDRVGFALETQTRPVYGNTLLRRRPGLPRWSRTSWPTSGSATASRSNAGRTSGSTRASPRTPSGCGASTRASGTVQASFDRRLPRVQLDRADRRPGPGRHLRRRPSTSAAR